MRHNYYQSTIDRRNDFKWFCSIVIFCILLVLNLIGFGILFVAHQIADPIIQSRDWQIPAKRPPG